MIFISDFYLFEFLLCFCFQERESHRACLTLTVQLKLALNSWPSSLCLPSAEIIGMCFCRPDSFRNEFYKLPFTCIANTAEAPPYLFQVVYPERKTMIRTSNRVDWFCCYYLNFLRHSSHVQRAERRLTYIGFEITPRKWNKFMSLYVSFSLSISDYLDNSYVHHYTINATAYFLWVCHI